MSRNDQSQDVEKPDRKKSRQTDKQAKRIEQLEAEIEQLTQDLQRERADFANYRRRMEQDKQQAKTAARTELVEQLLPVIDDMERALAYTPEELQGHSWAEGVEKVYEQLRNTLRGIGLERIQADAQPFDPQLHEAVGYEDGDGSEEVVIEELRAGYMLDESVLRPSMVRVGTRTSQNEADNKHDKAGDKDVKEDDNG